MAVENVLANGTVTIWSGTPTVVGSSLQYADGSDTTYAAHTTYGNSSDPFEDRRQDITRCALEQPPSMLGDTSQTTLTSITANIRYKATISTGAGSVPGMLGVILGTPGVDPVTPGLDLTAVTDNTPHNLSYLLTEDDYDGNGVTILDVVQSLIVGDEVLLRANMAFGTNNTRVLTVYEFSLDIEYELISEPPELAAGGWTIGFRYGG